LPEVETGSFSAEAQSRSDRAPIEPTDLRSCELDARQKPK